MNKWGKEIVLLIMLVALAACSDEDEIKPILVESIQITGGNITNGSSTQLTAIVFPADANNLELLWKVNDATVASVTSTGLVTAKKNGTVQITATATDGSGVSAQKTVTISGFHNGTIVNTVGELTTAISNAKAGDSIYVHGGTYAITSKITITQSGSATAKIYLFAFPEDSSRPRFDFSSMTESSSNQGIVLQGSYWHIKGIDIYKAGDNGLQIRGGSNNIIEFCTFSECSDTGLQIDNGASNNLILNCDSYYNADSSIENADGFACKLNAGTGNKFVGCRAWQNLDDGWDGYLRGADNITTTYENCWAFKNGYLKNGNVSGGDGNGFKTGGSDDKLLKHHGVYKNCLAVANLVDGFDHNSNRGNISMYNCFAYSNGTNMGFGSTNQVGSLVMKNCAVLGATGNLFGSTIDITNNSWQNGITCDALDFVSVDITLLTAARKPTGDLPDITSFHLVLGSDLIDKGIDVGLPFIGSKPDLGVFEFQ